MFIDLKLPFGKFSEIGVCEFAYRLKKRKRKEQLLGSEWCVSIPLCLDGWKPFIGM